MCVLLITAAAATSIHCIQIVRALAYSLSSVALLVAFNICMLFKLFKHTHEERHTLQLIQHTQTLTFSIEILINKLIIRELLV